MSKSETPISDAVEDAQAEGGTISWDIAIGAKCPQDEGPWRGVMYVRSLGYGPEFASWEDKDDGNKYQPATPADAAAALRLVADALKPDPTRRALEMVVSEFGSCECPRGNLEWDGCAVSMDDVARCEKDNVECWVAYWLEQAERRSAWMAKQAEQAEAEAAKNEGETPDEV